MRTIYITGIKKYRVSILKGLLKSDLIEGKDFIEGSSGYDHALYWLGDHVTLKDFKLAIGAKYIWKHRMRFFNTYDEMKPPTVGSTELTETEKRLLSSITQKYAESKL